MESTDILIIILMFAMPVVSAILDRKKKAGKNAGQTTRRQIQRPAPFEPFTSDDPDFPDFPEEESGEMEEEEVFSPEPPEEGASAASSIEKHPAAEPEQSSGTKEKIDARKLIVYDAIMNPKFKE